MYRYTRTVLTRVKWKQLLITCLWGTLSLTLVATVCFYQSTKPPPAPHTPWYKLPGARCRLKDSELLDLVSLAFRMHDVLDSLHAPHALCYGTLWGALRQGQVLAWDTNIDICLMDTHLQNVSFSQLQEAFMWRGAWLDYDWKAGVYHLSYRGVRGFLHVFSQTLSRDGDEVVVPGGWSQAVWRMFGQRQLTFPAWVLEAPFKAETFHGRDFPVPHEGIELLKYQYPDDWWLEVKPAGCD